MERFLFKCWSSQRKRTREVLDLLNESLGDLVFERDDNDVIDRKCKLCDTGQLSLKNSFRGGAFIGCSNYPECKFTRPLSKSKASQQINLAEPKLIGKNDLGKDIFLKMEGLDLIYNLKLNLMSWIKIKKKI